jgi:DNA-binding NtrC family response regulator
MSGASDNHQAQKQQKEEHGTPSVPPLSVLVLDDKGLADILAHVLNISGFQPIPAHTGDEAIKIAEETALDVALLDLHMVYCGDPIEFAERIRKLQPRCRVIIMGAATMTMYFQSLPHEVSSRFEFLAKPIHPVDLFRFLRETRKPGD